MHTCKATSQSKTCSQFPVILLLKSGLGLVMQMEATHWLPSKMASMEELVWQPGEARKPNKDGKTLALCFLLLTADVSSLLHKS